MLGIVILLGNICCESEITCKLAELNSYIARFNLFRIKNEGIREKYR